MKKHLPILLLILLVASSFLYLIPGFSYINNNQRYTFTNFPSLVDKAFPDFRLNLPNQTATYSTIIESTDKINDANEWSKIASRDQKAIEQRLESVIGNDYEIRLHNNEGKVKFDVLTTDRLYTPTLLTSSNSIFQIFSESSTQATLTTGETSQNQKELLDLKREDFGFAEVLNTPTQSQTTGEPEYNVRLPLALFLGTEKINIINNNVFSKLTVQTTEAEYTASIDSNLAGVPTHLLIKAISSKTEAEYLRSFLNSPQYKLTYSKVSENYYVNNYKQIWILVGMILIVLIASIILNRYTVKNFTFKKMLLILGLLIIYFASLKLFAIPLTLTSLLVMTIITLFTIFNTKIEFYITFIGILLFCKLLGFLPGFDISIINLCIIIIFTFLIWLTNYVQKSDKKYL